MPARRSFSFGHFAVKLAWSFQIPFANPSRGRNDSQDHEKLLKSLAEICLMLFSGSNCSVSPWFFKCGTLRVSRSDVHGGSSNIIIF